MLAAGAAHSSAVTADGVVLTWRSMDPALSSQEVGGPLAGKQVVAVSAGEAYRNACPAFLVQRSCKCLLCFVRIKDAS